MSKKKKHKEAKRRDAYERFEDVDDKDLPDELDVLEWRYSELQADTIHADLFIRGHVDELSRAVEVLRRVIDKFEECAEADDRQRTLDARIEMLKRIEGKSRRRPKAA